MAEIALQNAFVRAVVSPVAGMLLDAAFLIDGVEHRPFARAPWIGDPGLDDQPGHLRMLGGEFVAVPFGSVGAPADIAASWHGIVPAEPPSRPHGPSADDEWAVVRSSADAVALALAYPEDEGIERVEREVRLRADAAAIDFTLTLHARRPVDTAVGLHPIFRLPSIPRALTLSAAFDVGHTYPGPVWPGRGPTAPGQTFDELDRVPARDGGTLDLSALPLEAGVEDVVLLAGVRSPVDVRFADTGTHVVLDWDRAVIPHVMLWISDGVLEEAPWNGRYRGLGVEPIAAAFDFPNEVSVAPNPLSMSGHRTSVHVEPGAPVRISYSVECRR